MGSTEDSVASCYDEQKRLEQEEQDKLLEREPGEAEDEGVPKADILDISMEDQEAPPNSSIRDGSDSSVTNPNRGKLPNNPSKTLEQIVVAVAAGTTGATPAPDLGPNLIRGGECSGAGSAPGADAGVISTINKVAGAGTGNKMPNINGCGVNTGTGYQEKNNERTDAGAGTSNTTNLNRGDVAAGTGIPNPNEGGLSNKTKLYLAAKTNAGSITLPNLAGGGRVPVIECGSFIVQGDSRFEKITLRSDVNAGKNVSYSFDPDSMSCSCCGQFRTRGGEGFW
jgi:hypothetical protein